MIAPYLNGEGEIQIRPIRNIKDYPHFQLTVQNVNNIQKVRADFVENTLNVVTGISGSGKTTLVLDSLLPSFEQRFSKEKLSANVQLNGGDNINQIVEIDSSPIGKNIRSTVATYSKIMDKLRDLYGSLTASFNASDFSYNNNSGSCDYCSGTGSVTLDVQYLPDITEVCPVCHGKRYKPEILDIKWNHYSIADILDLSITEALEVFEDQVDIYSTLQVLNDLGLGYLRLGESTPALSGGEAQRLKLANYLGKKEGNVLFIFDEPSIGLHPKDVGNLVQIFEKLLDNGATVIVIEHDMDVIANADNIIDMGPQGGRYGGRLIANGPLEEVMNTSESITGRYLKEHFASSPQM